MLVVAAIPTNEVSYRLIKATFQGKVIDSDNTDNSCIIKTIVFSLHVKAINGQNVKQMTGGRNEFKCCFIVYILSVSISLQLLSQCENCAQLSDVLVTS